MLNLIAIVLLISLIVGVLPRWPYSSGWGYYPSGGVGFILLVLLIWMLFGR